MKLLKENPAAKLILVGRDVPDIISGSNSTWEMMKGLFSRSIAECNLFRSVPYTEIQSYQSNYGLCFSLLAEAFTCFLD
jgi:hypothetical protein